MTDFFQTTEAIVTNASGWTGPAASVQRASASTATVAPSASRTIGW